MPPGRGGEPSGRRWSSFCRNTARSSISTTTRDMPPRRSHRCWESTRPPYRPSSAVDAPGCAHCWNRRDWHENLSSVHEGTAFYPEEKEAMTERLMRASQAPARRARPRRMAAAGVAAALVLTVGVGAAATGVLKSAGEAFSRIRRRSRADRDHRPDRTPHRRKRYGGRRDHYGRRHCGRHVQLRHRLYHRPGGREAPGRGPDPNAFGYLPLLRFGDADVDVGQRGGAHGSSYFFDADPEDNAVQYVDLRTGDTPLHTGDGPGGVPGTCRSTTDNDYTKTTPVAQGKWKMRFAFQFEDSSRAFRPGSPSSSTGWRPRWTRWSSLRFPSR